VIFWVAVEVFVDVWVWVWVFVLVSVLVDSLEVVPELSEDVAVFAALVADTRAVWAVDAAPASALLACWATVPVPPDPQAATAITHTTAAPPRRSGAAMNLANDPATAHLHPSRAIGIGSSQCQGAPCG
jgi:hypothetical protein